MIAGDDDDDDDRRVARRGTRPSKAWQWTWMAMPTSLMVISSPSFMFPRGLALNEGGKWKNDVVWWSIMNPPESKGPGEVHE